MNNFFLNTLLDIHLSIFFALVLSYALRVLIQKQMIPISAKNEMTINHMLVMAVLILPVLAVMTSEQFHFQPIAKAYIAGTYREFDSLHKTAASEKIIFGTQNKSQSIPIESLRNGLLLLIIFTTGFSLIRATREIRVLRTLLKRATIFRSINRTRIAFSEDIQIPFSFLSWKFAWVVVPTSFLENSNKTRMSILHELQHHRQSDTRWLFLFQCIKALFGISPAFHIWMRILSEIQELKVDENLVDQGKVKPREYARCLIEVVETAVTEERKLVCATGLAFLPDRQQLTRRIESMFKKKMGNQVVALALGGLLLSSMTALALTTGKIVGTQKVTLAEAESLAANVRENSKFPIVVNDLVLEQLNRYIGTAQGREFMRNALQRMETYRTTIESMIKSYSYDMPMELIAVPIIESGYQNLPESQNPQFAAGLWQMIPGTARVFGLRVDKIKDERLDVSLETDASLRYILANQLRFGDWQLAMLAYNMGEASLQAAIDEAGSRNAWDIIRAGHENDKGYLAKLMAAILIMKNPSLAN